MGRDKARIELGGVTRPVTVMFCDIRNFTPLSETMPAADLVRRVAGGRFAGPVEDEDPALAVENRQQHRRRVQDHLGKGRILEQAIRRPSVAFDRGSQWPPPSDP